VSYLHEALNCASNMYELNFYEDEKGDSDSEGSISTSEEDLVLSTYLDENSFHITRSTTYDEAKAKKV